MFYCIGLAKEPDCFYKFRNPENDDAGRRSVCQGGRWLVYPVRDKLVNLIVFVPDLRNLSL